MNGAVIDTNVLGVAERNHPPASEGCILACVTLLQKVEGGDWLLVIDDGNRIFDEYRRNVTTEEQPGVGGRFYLWLLQNRWNEAVCEQVPITPIPNSSDGCDFEEFPMDPELKRFDRDDRKFVATARASSYTPPIFNASDSDWWIFRESLARNSVDLRFLCPELMGEP